MKKQNEDEKNELLFYLQDEHDFWYNKTSIFERSKCAKFFAKSVIVTEIGTGKVDQKHRKKAIFGRFWTNLPVYISVIITDFAKIFAHLERSKIEVFLYQKSCSSCK